MPVDARWRLGEALASAAGTEQHEQVGTHRRLPPSFERWAFEAANVARIIGER